MMTFTTTLSIQDQHPDSFRLGKHVHRMRRFGRPVTEIQALADVHHIRLGSKNQFPVVFICIAKQRVLRRKKKEKEREKKKENKEVGNCAKTNRIQPT